MSDKPEVRAETATEDQVEDRLQMLTEMVIFGASRHEVYQFAEKVWNLSRRTAQDYFRRVQELLLRDEAAQDALFYRKLSQLQRDKLVGVVLRYANDHREQLDPRIMQSLAALVTAARGLLDSRDKAAGEIHQLVADQLRDARRLASCKLETAEANEAPAAETQSGLSNGHGSMAPVGQVEAKPEHALANGKENGRKTTPPPRAASGVRKGKTWPMPKSNGRKRMPLVEDITDQRTPDCAGCADAPARGRGATAVSAVLVPSNHG